MRERDSSSLGLSITASSTPLRMAWSKRLPTSSESSSLAPSARSASPVLGGPASGTLLKRGRLTDGSPQVYASPIVAEIGGIPFIPWTVALYEIGSIVMGAASGLLTLRYGLRRPMTEIG